MFKTKEKDPFWIQSEIEYKIMKKMFSDDTVKEKTEAINEARQFIEEYNHNRDRNELLDGEFLDNVYNDHIVRIFNNSNILTLLNAISFYERHFKFCRNFKMWDESPMSFDKTFIIRDISQYEVIDLFTAFDYNNNLKFNPVLELKAKYIPHSHNKNLLDQGCLLFFDRFRISDDVEFNFNRKCCSTGLYPYKVKMEKGKVINIFNKQGSIKFKEKLLYGQYSAIIMIRSGYEFIQDSVDIVLSSNIYNIENYIEICDVRSRSVSEYQTSTRAFNDVLKGLGFSE